MLSCVSFRVESFALRASSVNDILTLLLLQDTALDNECSTRIAAQ